MKDFFIFGTEGPLKITKQGETFSVSMEPNLAPDDLIQSNGGVIKLNLNSIKFSTSFDKQSLLDQLKALVKHVEKFGG